MFIYAIRLIMQIRVKRQVSLHTWENEIPLDYRFQMSCFFHAMIKQLVYEAFMISHICPFHHKHMNDGKNRYKVRFLQRHT